MYDLLYQVYCAKLTKGGSDFVQETQLREWIREGKVQRQADAHSFGSKGKNEKPWYKDD